MEEDIFQQLNPKINPVVVVKSFLESSCKQFRLIAKRENFSLKPETQLRKTHFSKGGNYTCQYNEVEEKLQPVLFICVWTIFEHRVNDMNTSQKFQSFF